MPLRNAQSGVILITGLILLFVIAIAAVTSMQISNLDYKMATNTAFKNQSFQASESGRIAAGDAINQFIYDRTWVGVTPHSGIIYNSSFYFMCSYPFLKVSGCMSVFCEKYR